MRVIVTGGAGQLGTLVLRRLAARRAVTSIVCLDVRPPSVAIARVRAVNIDVRDPAIGSHFEGADALVHLAFVVTQHRPRAEFDAINVGGSKNVFEAAQKAGVRQIVYASSVAAYGCVPGHPVPIVEDTPRRHQPDFAYSATKFEVEAFLDAFEARHPEVAVCRFRPGVLVGARMEHPLGQAMRKRILIDTGSPPMPIVWDEDAADAVMLALERPTRGAFNLVTDDALSAADLARASGLRRVGIPRPILSGVARLSPVLTKLGIETMDPAWTRSADVSMVVSSTRARDELGWKPRFPKAADVARQIGDTAPGALDPRIALFMRLVALAARYAPPIQEAARIVLRIHAELLGPGGGDFTMLIDHGRLTVLSGVPRPPDGVVSLQARLFLDLLADRTSVATAMLTGKLRVEGEPVSGQIFGALVVTFVNEAKKPGARGWPARRLQSFIRSTRTEARTPARAPSARTSNGHERRQGAP